MTTETVLTEVERLLILKRVNKEVNLLPNPFPYLERIAIDIEQAVLQSPEVQALRKDADRYRHLRDEVGLCPYDIFNAWWMSDHGNPQTIDEAIDISMEQKP
ncbi:hypothetical protein ABRZ10_07125 [Castellaniella ginsengisoli]|uniref:Uncharacterized protein n=1 Tax=Castellaniella ginsengisoli TaxID=546114 RepID=A0AB39DVV4_9BURK